MITAKQSAVIGNGFLELIQRDNDVKEIEKLRRAHEQLQMQYSNMQKRFQELQLWASDLEENFAERVNERLEESFAELLDSLPTVAETGSDKPNEFAPAECAILQVERDGEYTDTHGKRWVTIADCALIKNVSYQTIYRAAKGITKSAYIAVWTVGQLDNGNDRLLVDPDSYQRGKAKTR